MSIKTNSHSQFKMVSLTRRNLEEYKETIQRIREEINQIDIDSESLINKEDGSPIIDELLFLIQLEQKNILRSKKFTSLLKEGLDLFSHDQIGQLINLTEEFAERYPQSTATKKLFNTLMDLTLNLGNDRKQYVRKKLNSKAQISGSNRSKRIWFENAIKNIGKAKINRSWDNYKKLLGVKNKWCPSTTNIAVIGWLLQFMTTLISLINLIIMIESKKSRE